MFDAVCRAVQAEGMTTREAYLTTGIISVSASMTRWSWGEDAYLKVWSEADGMVAVGVRSQLKFGLVDWGKNTRNIEKLFARISQSLETSGSFPFAVVTPSAPPGWHQDPSARHQLRYWDGTIWTADVADGNVVATDPL